MPGDRWERRFLNWDTMSEAMKIEAMHLDLGALSTKVNAIDAKVKEIAADVQAIKSIDLQLQALRQVFTTRPDGNLELSKNLFVSSGADILLD